MIEPPPDTIPFSVYADLRLEFDWLQGKYDKLMERLDETYQDNKQLGKGPKLLVTARLETLLNRVNAKPREIPPYKDRTSQYTFQMIADELQSVVNVLHKEEEKENYSRVEDWDEF